MQERDKYILENYKTKSYRQIAEELKLPYDRVRTRAYELGCRKHSKIKWTKEIENDIKENYPRHGYSNYFAEKYPNIPRTAIQKKASSLGVKYIPKRKSVANTGYVEVYKTVKGVTYREYEHRIVAEDKIGRPLKKDEVVHHINGDPRDNRPENLQVMTRAEHMNVHRECLKLGRGI